MDRLKGFVEVARLLHEMPKPTTAMINGPLAGAGIGIAGACDLRFAGRSATFVAAFDRIGGGGDFGACWFWTKIVGTSVARDLFLVGAKLDPDQVYARGLYTWQFDDAALADETVTAARRRADVPLIDYRYVKKNLNNAEDFSFKEVLDVEALQMVQSTQVTAQIWKVEKSGVPPFKQG